MPASVAAYHVNAWAFCTRTRARMMGWRYFFLFALQLIRTRAFSRPQTALTQTDSQCAIVTRVTPQDVPHAPLCYPLDYDERRCLSSVRLTLTLYFKIFRQFRNDGSRLWAYPGPTVSSGRWHCFNADCEKLDRIKRQRGRSRDIKADGNEWSDFHREIGGQHRSLNISD